MNHADLVHMDMVENGLEPAPPIPKEERDLAILRCQTLETLSKRIDFASPCWEITPDGAQWKRLMDEQGEYERRFNL